MLVKNWVRRYLVAVVCADGVLSLQLSLIFLLFWYSFTLGWCVFVSLKEGQCRLMGLDMICDHYACTSVWQHKHGPSCMTESMPHAKAGQMRFFSIYLTPVWLTVSLGIRLTGSTAPYIRPHVLWLLRILSCWKDASWKRDTSPVTDGFLISKILAGFDRKFKSSC